MTEIHTTAIRLPETIFAQLNELSRQTGNTRTALIRTAIAEYLGKWEV